MSKLIIEIVLAIGAVLAACAVGATCMIGLAVWLAGVRQRTVK